MLAMQPASSGKYPRSFKKVTCNYFRKVQACVKYPC